MIGMLVAGTCNTVFLKLQDSAVALGKEYNHAFFQCAVMFVGELACLGAYFVKNLYMRNQKKEEETPMSPGTAQAN